MTRIRVSLVTLGDPETLTGGYLYHRRIAELAPEHGAEVRFVSFPALPFPLPAAARRTVAASAADADAIVLDSIAAAFWTGRSGGPPVVVMAHQPPGGIDHGPLRTRVQAALDRRAYRGAAHFMVASEALVPAFERDGLPDAATTVVPPGRDVARDVPAAADLRDGRAIAVLCVGNWVPRKGIVDLLDAVSFLPRSAATLHLVGDDRVDPDYAARVRARLGGPTLRGRVHVHGRRSRNEVAQFYAAADAFALPSVREPYGTVYAEAMAFGLPVVGWDAGNLPHLARDDEEGLIVRPLDVPALARALERLARDDELRGRLARNARRRAESFPTWSETAHLFFATIRRVVEARA